MPCAFCWPVLACHRRLSPYASHGRARAWEIWPYVSLLVAAKNEETVIEPLVAALCQLEYPAGRYEVWIIDDNSTDGTTAACKPSSIATRNCGAAPQHRGQRRQVGRLNQVWPDTKGDIIGVFDAMPGFPGRCCATSCLCLINLAWGRCKCKKPLSTEPKTSGPWATGRDGPRQLLSAAAH
jgi:hypothetical protein